MRNNATTDEIFHSAWINSKKYWKEFVLFPVIVSAVFIGVMGALTWTMTPSGGLGGIILFLTIGLCLFLMTFFAAQIKWCEEIHQGAQGIDIKNGLKYGLSRFWGLLGTGILTAIKIFLWLLLLIIPGYYKGIMYSKSVYVSVLEKVSGGDANRISETIVKKAGPMRTLANTMGISFLGTFALYIIIAIAVLIGAIIGMVHELTGAIVIGLILTVFYTFAMTVIMSYFHFEYLYFRDEAKDEITKLKKALS